MAPSRRRRHLRLVRIILPMMTSRKCNRRQSSTSTCTLIISLAVIFIAHKKLSRDFFQTCSSGTQLFETFLDGNGMYTSLHYIIDGSSFCFRDAVEEAMQRRSWIEGNEVRVLCLVMY